MLNQLEALRYFCAVAEHLHFRSVAQRFAVSPQVVSRMINELETLLGEPLFKRSTRNVQLTDFGEQFLPKAQQLLADSEQLFQRQHHQPNEMAGIVRIFIPPLHDQQAVLAELLTALQDYPDIIVQWHVDYTPHQWIEKQIDIGIRVNVEPDPRLIVRPITTFRECIVAAPALIERLGMPKDLNDLRRYPMSSMINPETGRAWHWQIDAETVIVPKQPLFLSNDIYAEIQATLSGRVCSQLVDYLIEPYLASGQLVPLFPQLVMQPWQLYLYRLYTNPTPPRVKWVFQILSDILQRRYQPKLIE